MIIMQLSFWKAIKSLLSDKIKSPEKIFGAEGEKLVTNYIENVDIVNELFKNTVKNIRIRFQ